VGGARLTVGGGSGLAGYGVDQARLRHQRLRGDVQGIGDGLEHADRGLVQAPLDLAQVRVGQAGHLGQLPQRQISPLALLADEGAERLSLGIP
jgi:hypothetical protein